MYLFLWSLSRSRYSLSMSDSILFLIITGYALNMVIYLIIALISSVCVSTFLDFMILTHVASIIIALSFYISLSTWVIFFSASEGILPSAGCGIKFYLILGASKSVLSFNTSFGSSSFGTFGLAFAIILVFGLQRRKIDSLKSLSAICVFCLHSATVNWSCSLNRLSTAAWKQLTYNWYFFFK